jgi:hypothetical protein
MGGNETMRVFAVHPEIQFFFFFFFFFRLTWKMPCQCGMDAGQTLRITQKIRFYTI